MSPKTRCKKGERKEKKRKGKLFRTRFEAPREPEIDSESYSERNFPQFFLYLSLFPIPYPSKTP